jgi:hypothetical protein
MSFRGVGLGLTVTMGGRNNSDCGLLLSFCERLSDDEVLFLLKES